MASSLAPACLLAVSAVLHDDHAWLVRVLVVVLGTIPALGAVAAFRHAGVSSRVVRPLVPYAVLAAVFAVVCWAVVLFVPQGSADGPSGFADVVFVGFLYSVPALPVLALVGGLAVLHLIGSREDASSAAD